MKKKINLYAFERASHSMAKKFGTIKKGDEESYSMLLFPMEGNLLKVNRIHQINKNGYFDFLERQIGKTVPDDDEMNYTAAGRQDA